jgi:hypothetical protein
MVSFPPAFASETVPIAYVAYADATPACRAADIAVTSLSVKVSKHKTVDHYVVTGNVQNVGHHTQAATVQQHVELLRDGIVVVPQVLPPLDKDIVYPVSFSLDRPAIDRGTPLVLTLRYVAASKTPVSENCSGANDSLTKTF